jgi:hypothetical protein
MRMNEISTTINTVGINEKFPTKLGKIDGKSKKNHLKKPNNNINPPNVPRKEKAKKYGNLIKRKRKKSFASVSV